MITIVQQLTEVLAKMASSKRLNRLLAEACEACVGSEGTRKRFLFVDNYNTIIYCILCRAVTLRC